MENLYFLQVLNCEKSVINAPLAKAKKKQAIFRKERDVMKTGLKKSQKTTEISDSSARGRILRILPSRTHHGFAPWGDTRTSMEGSELQHGRASYQTTGRKERSANADLKTQDEVLDTHAHPSARYAGYPCGAQEKSHLRMGIPIARQGR